MQSDLGFVCLFVDGVQGQLLCVKCTHDVFVVAQIHNFKCFFVSCVRPFQDECCFLQTWHVEKDMYDLLTMLELMKY